MAIENLYATSAIFGSTWANPSNAVGNTPTTWAGVSNTNSTESGRWHIGDPVDPLTVGATQTIHCWARKGSNAGNPSITMNLWENGVLIREIESAIAITSTTGQLIDGTFLSSEITNRANVEIEVIGVFVGGSPSNRNSPQIAYIHWEADTTAAVGPASIAGIGSTSVTTSGIGGITVSDPPLDPAVISGVGSTSLVTSGQGGIVSPGTPVAISDLSGEPGNEGEIVLSWTEPVGVQ